jgi:hypothetical protein
MPIERKWLDKPYCFPFVFPWEIQLTDHFGLEHITNPLYDLQIELVDDTGDTTGVITSSFDLTVGLDSNDKNVYVAILREYPVNMPTNFRLMITITNGADVVYNQVTESYIFVNDQCLTAHVASNNEWAAIATGGRLIVNGSSYQVGVTGTGLPNGLTFGINSTRQESSIGSEAGLVYELYGEDGEGNRIIFRNPGIVCNKGQCHTDTLLIEGLFDCSAPDGRYVGSILPYQGLDDDIRYRYQTRVYADLIEMPADITRTIAINNKVQRTERVKRYQLVSYEPLPGWQRDELETILMGAKVFIQGEEFVFTTGKPFERMGVIGTSGWWLKADLEQIIERKEYSCEVVCLTCLKPTGLSFQILPDPCDPLTGLRATTTLNDDGMVKLIISASNTIAATSFKIGYRVQGDTSFIYLSPNPFTLPVTINNLVNQVYEVEVTKYTSGETCPPLVAISNATNLNPFDYLVVRYIWTSEDGRDLDTFTGFINTGTAYDNDWVGYAQGDPKVPTGAADASASLFWASDNTQSGVEAVLMNLKQFVTDNTGTATEIQIRMNAVWWGQRLTGNVGVQLTTYLGGTMAKKGFDFINTGGNQVDQITLQTNVDKQSNSASITNSIDVAIVKYNKNTKAATIQLV